MTATMRSWKNVSIAVRQNTFSTESSSGRTSLAATNRGVVTCPVLRFTGTAMPSNYSCGAEALLDQASIYLIRGGIPFSG